MEEIIALLTRIAVALEEGNALTNAMWESNIECRQQERILNQKVYERDESFVQWQRDLVETGKAVPAINTWLAKQSPDEHDLDEE